MSNSAVATDRDLVAAVIEGDETAFRSIYRRHTPALYGFVLRTLGGDQLTADDVVQDTWIKAVEKFPEFRWESSIKTWLTGIALNNCRRVFRQNKRDFVELSEIHMTVHARKGEMLDVEEAIAELPQGYRAVLLLHDVEGYRHHEIAEMLDISAGTSKSQLSRARSALREMLEPSRNDQEENDNVG